MKILVTAFEPFGGENVNPAQEAVRLMCAPAGVTLIRLSVPTVFRRCLDPVRAAMRTQRPDAVLCVGQAGGRAALTPERVAINLDDARIPDNDGECPADAPVRAGGPVAYFATLPVKAMVRAIHEAGLPAALSCSAGTFVCNHLMYGVLDTIAREYPAMIGGFIHVPFLPQQAAAHDGAPSLPLTDMIRGLEAALGAIAQTRPAAAGR